MRGTAFALAALTFLALPAGTAAARTTHGTRSAAADERDIAAQAAAWNAAYAAADWQRLRALYADGAWLMTDKAPAAKSPEAIIAYLRRHHDQGASVRFQFQPENIRVDRPWAFLVSKYWMTAQGPGRPPYVGAGRSLLIYHWERGGWKLWRDIDNTSPDVTAADRPPEP